ncbi:MAG: PEP-CTERM sorting domain-containing protein [bacterium]
MKKTLLLMVSILMMSVISGEASWSQAFKTDEKPNLVTLWSSQPFESADLPAGWTYWQDADGLQSQWFTTGDYGIQNIIGTQWWTGSKTDLYLDAVESWYDWDTGKVVQSWDFGLYYPGSGAGSAWSIVPMGSAGGSLDVLSIPGSPHASVLVPEPASILLFCSGLIGIFLLKKIGKSHS